MAKHKNPSGLSTAVKPYLAASAAASEQTIALPNYLISKTIKTINEKRNLTQIL
jgi:hypothetical protein